MGAVGGTAIGIVSHDGAQRAAYRRRASGSGEHIGRRRGRGRSLPSLAAASTAKASAIGAFLGIPASSAFPILRVSPGGCQVRSSGCVVASLRAVYACSVRCGWFAVVCWCGSGVGV